MPLLTMEIDKLVNFRWSFNSLKVRNKIYNWSTIEEFVMLTYLLREGKKKLQWGRFQEQKERTIIFLKSAQKQPDFQ